MQRIILRFFLLLIAIPLAVSASDQKVHSYTLWNGLKILIKEDHRAPVVVSQVWYKVGSSYEPSGVTGISHMLEHMMFKGTEKHLPGEFSRIIAENGGRENAFTGRDYTAYFQSLEKSRLPISFELEADRMRNLRLIDEEFQKERQVVIEERRMRTEDNPQAKTGEHFMAMAWTNSQYKNPIIGWPEDLENYRLSDLQGWYDRWYAPNNATLVVVGDVKADEVLALAKKHFGLLQPDDLIILKSRREEAQLGERRMVVKLPAKLPFLTMGYKVPALNTAETESEAYALEVLAGVLDGGNGARLASRLIRGQQIATAAGAGYNLYARLSTLFSLEGIPAKGQDLKSLESALREQISILKKEPVSAKELARIKAQVLANSIYEQDSVFYQAMQLGMAETVGLGWHKVDEYVDKVKAVTAEQVMAVAQKYLTDERLSVAWLEPLEINIPQSTTIQGGAE
ncbi:MAG: insulinase family protein [Gammaproteobacteria bacterium]|nr:MAG: insulinase family protein [Gammaproteobacteria bacterium]